MTVKTVAPATGFLPLHAADRDYKPHDEQYEAEGPGQIPHRRLTQHEIHLRWQLSESITPHNEAEWKGLADTLELLDDAANETLSFAHTFRPMSDEEKEAARQARQKIHQCLSDALMTLCYGAQNDGVTIGLLAGQRMGLRLGLGLAARLFFEEDTGTPLPAIPRHHLTALVAGAQVDDTLADRLIGWLLTGHEPEFIQGTPVKQEGGAAE